MKCYQIRLLKYQTMEISHVQHRDGDDCPAQRLHGPPFGPFRIGHVRQPLVSTLLLLQHHHRPPPGPVAWLMVPECVLCVEGERMG